MSYEEEEKPTCRLDLGGHHTRKKQQEQSGFTNWRTSSRMATVDDLFKTIVAMQKGKANIHRTSNNDSNSTSKVRSASMSPQQQYGKWDGEVVPNICQYWSLDSNVDEITKYNNKVIADYHNNHNNKRSRQQ